MSHEQFIHIIQKYKHQFHPVVSFNPSTQKLIAFDFTKNNKELTPALIADTVYFSKYIEQQLAQNQALYGIGGYGEHRTVYGMSPLFNDYKRNTQASYTSNEPRRFHLGIDIWGKEGTQVFVPFGGMIHSFAFNDNYGGYGVTIILLHQLDGFPFYTLYGHLSKKDVEHIHEGQYVNAGNVLAHFGNKQENGHWPPHLHFQVIFDLGTYRGDYPGVCKFSEREIYLANCPNPDLILQLNKYIADTAH